MEEKMNIGGEEITPESTLKQMRKACEFLKIGKTGSRAQVWQRLQQAVATSKLKETIENATAQKKLRKVPIAGSKAPTAAKPTPRDGLDVGLVVLA